jgi:hypothetical protein
MLQLVDAGGFKRGVQGLAEGKWVLFVLLKGFLKVVGDPSRQEIVESQHQQVKPHQVGIEIGADVLGSGRECEHQRSSQRPSDIFEGDDRVYAAIVKPPNLSKALSDEHS